MYKKYGSSNVNSKKALQNRLLDLYIASISNPLQYSESKQPLDAVTSYLTDKILKDIDSLQSTEKKKMPQLYNATPGFQNKTKADLIAGKTNLGAVALGNSHHMLAQSVNLSQKISKEASKLNISNLSSIYSQQPNYHDKQTIITLISDWISAMVNAHVDVAKDPYINRLNVRKFTINTTNFLLRAGKGESTFYFLSQKILRDAADKFEAYSGSYGVEDTKFGASYEAIRKVKEEYSTRAKELLGISDTELKDRIEKVYSNNDSFNIDYLRSILPTKDTGDWYVSQLAILDVYEKVEPYARALSELTKLSQIDTKKYGNNFALQQNFLIKMAEFSLNNKTFPDPLSVIRDTFLKEKLINGLIRPRKYLGSIFVRTTEAFENKRRAIYKLLGKDNTTMSDEFINNITRMMEVDYKSRFWIDYAKSVGVKVGSLLNGNNSIPRRLYKIKQSILQNPGLNLTNSDGKFSNALLDNINMMIKTDAQMMALPDFIQFKQNKSDDHNLDDHIIRAWEELLDLTVSDSKLEPIAKEIRDFARDLAIYAFFTSGDAFGRNNIFKYVPNSFRESSGYYDYIRKVEENPSEYISNISISEVLKNLWWSDEVVPPVNVFKQTYEESEYGFSKVLSVDDNVATNVIPSRKTIRVSGRDVNVPVSFTLNPFKSGKFLIGKNDRDQLVYTPFVKVNFGPSNNPLSTEIYKFYGTRIIQSKTGDVEAPVYVLSSKKGLKFRGCILTEIAPSYNSLIKSNNNPTITSINDSSITKNASFTLYSNNPYDGMGEIEYLERVLNNTTRDKSETSTSNISNTFTWDRLSDNGYEVSTKGDKRFSAFNATFKPGTIIDGVDVSNMTIEDVYQKVIKKSGKGQAPAEDSILNLDRTEQNGMPSWLDYDVDDLLPRDLWHKLYGVYAGNYEAAGMPVPDITKEDREDFSYYVGYLPLWQEWAKQNPELIEELREKAKGKTLTDQFANTRVNQARALTDVLNSTSNKENVNNTDNTENDPSNFNNEVESKVISAENKNVSISDFNLYSGAARGSDSEWANLARSKGIKVTDYTTYNYDELSDDRKKEIEKEYAEVVELLGRKKLPLSGEKAFSGKLVRRDMLQADSADAIFAISTVDKNGYVAGGTGYASTRGIIRGIPVYLFDQENNVWKIWDGDKFVETNEPVLTPKAAVIGTREINNNGKAAIKSVIDKTYSLLESNDKSEDTSVSKSFDDFVKEAGDIFDDAVVNKVKEDLNKQTTTQSSRPSFTFNDGTTVLTDFELNDQQKFALLELEKFFNSEETVFSLQGYAGTGKTTIMKVFDKYLNNRFLKPLYVSPTHKANAVTRANNPEAIAKTIHSLLGLSPDYDVLKDSFNLANLKFSSTSGMSSDVKNTIIIVDESSMLEDSLTDYLVEKSKIDNNKIIFIGDPAQLSPVGQDTEAKALNYSSKVELTKVERTGDNAILKDATSLRENNTLSYITDLNDKGDGIIYTNKESTLSFFLRNIVNKDSFKNPLELRILTGENKYIPSFNKIIRNILFGNNTPQLVKGDILMGYSNEQRTRDPKKPYKIINSGDYIVEDVGILTEKFIPYTDNKIKVVGYNVSLKDAYDNSIIEAFILDSNNNNNSIAANQVSNLVNNLWSVRSKLLSEGNRKEAGKIIDMINRINNSYSTMFDVKDQYGKIIKYKTFDYAYTQTVHKSQGATYNNVVVLEDTFNKFSESEKQKLKYVALTRAKNKVLYYTTTSKVNNRDITSTTSSKIKEMQDNVKRLSELGKERQNECK